MRHVFLPFLAICFLSLLLLAGCGGGGGGGGTDVGTNTSTDTGTDTGSDTQPPVISGFDFAFAEGNFWQYDWDFNRTYTAIGSNTNRTYRSTFRVTLGPPIGIGGITFYQVLLSGNTKAEDYKNFAPRWKYLAISGNKILASQDGVTSTIIFDAQSGAWPGSGFLTAFPSDKLFEATTSTINNDYLDESAYRVQVADFTDRCEFYPGIGNICGGDYDETLIEREYYIPGVGPVGLYQYTAISNYDWSATRTSHVGLVSSSFWNDISVTDLEIEPNNTLTNATPITLGSILEGDSVSEDVHGGPFTVSLSSAVNEVEPNNGPLSLAQSVSIPVSIDGDVAVGDNFSSRPITFNNVSWDAAIEDWYQFTLASSQNLTFTLDFQGTGPNADLDLFLFDSTGNLIDASPYWNPDTGQFFEEISGSIPAGTYSVGVDAATEMGPDRIVYSLDIASGNTSVDVLDWFTFTVAADSSIQLGIAGGPSMVVLDMNGATIASGTSINEDLGSGTYYIGVTAGGPYTLTTSSLSSGGGDGRAGGGGSGPGA